MKPTIHARYIRRRIEAHKARKTTKAKAKRETRA